MPRSSAWAGARIEALHRVAVLAESPQRSILLSLGAGSLRLSSTNPELGTETLSVMMPMRL